MTTYLLDTQIVLWAAGFVERLAPEVRDALESPDAQLLVSSVSIAEMAIKASIGKLTLPLPAVELCLELGLGELTLDWAAAGRVAELPMIHRDPFDRLLVAQAIDRSLTLVTADVLVAQYPDVSLLRN